MACIILLFHLSYMVKLAPDWLLFVLWFWRLWFAGNWLANLKPFPILKLFSSLFYRMSQISFELKTFPISHLQRKIAWLNVEILMESAKICRRWMCFIFLPFPCVIQSQLIFIDRVNSNLNLSVGRWTVNHSA